AAMTLVSQASDEAGDLARSAAEHGWTGLAEAMSSVGEALQDAVEGVAGARDATTESLARLSTIATEMSSEEVAARLASIVAGLASARTAATVATASLEDPRTVAQQADAHRVVERI